MKATGKRLGLVTLVVGAIAWSTWGSGVWSSDTGGRMVGTAGPAAVHAPTSSTTSGTPALPPRQKWATKTATKATGETPPAGMAPPKSASAGFSISPTSGPPETVITATGWGCGGFDNVMVQITENGFELEGGSLAPVAGDGSWSTWTKMPPAPVPGVDPYPGSWADPDRVYAVTATCSAHGDGPSPTAPPKVLRLPDQPFDLVAGPAATPAAPSEFFAGFWPESSEAEAAEMQAAFDDGHQPWRGDPETVARLFAEHIAGWRIEVTGSEVSGSAAEGWSAAVRFKAFIGEAELRPITAHTLQLVGLRGAEHPVWFVSGLSSDHIRVDIPSDGATVPSPVRVAGRASAYEGNVLVEVRDDSGRRLHSGHLQAEGVDMAPFQGSLELAPATTRGGILMVTGDTGAGPVPDMTIVRIRFR